MKWGRVFLLAGLAVLSGCATLSEKECRTVNWRDLGVKDGLMGHPAGRVEIHRKACAEYGIQPNEHQYLDGRDEGLREYCRIDNAFQSGLKGRQYQGVCPSTIDVLFRRCNDAAYSVYQSRSEIEQLNRNSSHKESQLREKKLTDAERHRLRDEIRDLDRKLSRLRDDLRNQERNLDDLMVKTKFGKRSH
jgi:hypothetical protein